MLLRLVSAHTSLVILVVAVGAQYLVVQSLSIGSFGKTTLRKFWQPALCELSELTELACLAAFL